jgi:hypothetical protein
MFIFILLGFIAKRCVPFMKKTFLIMAIIAVGCNSRQRKIEEFEIR